MSTTPRTDAWAQRVCLNWDGRGDCSREVVFADTARQLETELAAVTDERDALKVEYESRAIWIDRMNVILGCVNTDGRNCKDVHQVAAALVAERDALKHALIELESASEAYAADQSQATDSRCGLVQPITVEDGNRLLSALKIANDLTHEARKIAGGKQF